MNKVHHKVPEKLVEFTLGIIEEKNISKNVNRMGQLGQKLSWQLKERENWLYLYQKSTTKKFLENMDLLAYPEAFPKAKHVCL